MTIVPSPADLLDRLEALEQGLSTQLADLRRQLDGLDRRVDQRAAELRAKQDEELMLVKALSCQLRGRVERVERRGARGGV